MNPSITNLHSRAQVTKTLRRDSIWLLMFVLMVMIAIWGLWQFDPASSITPNLIFAGYTLTLCSIVAIVTRRNITQEREEHPALLEMILLGAYVVVYTVLVAMLKSQGQKDNLLVIWGPLVAIPAIYLWVRKYNWDHVGLDQQFVFRGLKLAVVTGLLWMPLLLYSNYVDSASGKAILTDWQGSESVIVLSVSFVLAFLFAGFPEEFFFRGVLQSTLHGVFQRPLPAILLCAFLFAAYHVPFAFLLPTWESYGNLGFSFALVIMAQFFSGLLYGVVYWKSNSLIAPVFLHTLLDTLVLYSTAQINL